MNSLNPYQYSLVDDETLLMQASEYEYPAVDPRLTEEVRRRGLEPQLLRALAVAQAIAEFAEQAAA